MDAEQLATRLADQLRAVPPRRRRAGAVLGTLALVAVLVLGGILPWPPTGTAALAGCGSLPTSDGPHRHTIRATLDAPATGAVGSLVEGTVTLRTTGSTETFSSGLPVDLLVVLGDRVVGRFSGDVGGVGAGGQIGPAGQAFPASGRLSACLSGLRVALGDTNADRAPLPPGVYTLVAAMDDYGDGASGVLVTDPVPITVTA